MESNRNICTGIGSGIGQGIGQDRRRGNCRALAADTQPNTSLSGVSKGLGLRRNRMSSMAPAGSVADLSSRLYSSDLQTLTEQAERMTTALKNIQDQIDILSGK